MLKKNFNMIKKDNKIRCGKPKGEILLWKI